MFHSLLLERKIPMGTCVSKCCSNPPPPFHSSPPQDKLVISQSLSLSKIQAAPSSSSSSSSSYSSSSSSSSSYGSNTSDSTGSRSSLKDSTTEPKPNKYPVKTSPPRSKLVRRPQKQPIARANQSLPSKRACSSTPPTLANQKSIKTELKLSSPSTRWSSKNATIRRQRHEVGVSGNAGPLRIAARKEKLLPSGPSSNLSGRQIIYRQVGENGSGGVFSEHSSRIPLMEDLNNPLISMDCFIFL